LTPLFAIELFESGLRFELLFLFATVEDFEKKLGDRISGVAILVSSCCGVLYIPGLLFRLRQHRRELALSLPKGRLALALNSIAIS
jgi:hypothetical protein